MDVLTITMNPALDREVIIPHFELNTLHRVFEREKLIYRTNYLRGIEKTISKCYSELYPY